MNHPIGICQCGCDNATHPRECAGCRPGPDRQHARCIDCHPILDLTGEHFPPRGIRRAQAGLIVRCRQCDRANDRARRTPDYRAARETQRQVYIATREAETAEAMRQTREWAERVNANRA